MIIGAPQQFVQPHIVSTHFHLRPGEVVADLGAGSGHFLESLSKMVTPSGRVYACEIQKKLVDALGAYARERHLPNIHPLWCDLEAEHGTTLGDGILDASIMVNTLFQIVEKEIALREVFRITRGGGKFLLIDWSDSFAGMGPQPQDVVTEDRARELVIGAGFTFERDFPAGDHHYGLAFRKPSV